MRRGIVLAAVGGLGLLVSGCGDDVPDVPLGAVPGDAGVTPDPLAVPDDALAAGSFDAIQTAIFAPRCAGTPGLCHNGQFEPNLATPAVAWASLYRRPAREDPEVLRVDPGSPDTSFLVAKLRGTAGSSQMPLGAEPLTGTDLAAIEAWIRDGALRAPGTDPGPALNEPPAAPELAVFDAEGRRLDDPQRPRVPVQVAVGQLVTLRMSVQDLETPASEIPFAVFSLRVGDGAFILHPERTDDPELGVAAYDGGDPPTGAVDLLDQAYTFTVPATGELARPSGRIPLDVPGTTFDLVGAYLDALPEAGGLIAFSVRPRALEVTE